MGQFYHEGSCWSNGNVGKTVAAALCRRVVLGRQEKGPARRTTGRLPGRGSLAAIPLVFYLQRQRLHEFLGVRQIALCGREVNARSFYAVTGHDGVEDGFVFCGFQFSLHWDFD